LVPAEETHPFFGGSDLVDFGQFWQKRGFLVVLGGVQIWSFLGFFGGLGKVAFLAPFLVAFWGPILVIFGPFWGSIFGVLFWVDFGPFWSKPDFGSFFGVSFFGSLFWGPFGTFRLEILGCILCGIGGGSEFYVESVGVFWPFLDFCILCGIGGGSEKS
jgi:hypothetical protein